MATFSNNLVAKNGKKVAKEFYCENCDYRCSKKYNWEKHLVTAKHFEATNINGKVAFCGKKLQTHQIFICEYCDKPYKDRSGLWRHKKTCEFATQQNTNHDDKINGLDKDELIIMLLKQNADLMKGHQDITMKVIENGVMNNSHNTTHTNSHNKAFNLNFFLNETCKNAMNITDFVDSIKLQLTDFMEVGEAGFVEGISNIIVKNLNNLDETVRPIHCTDKKRETFYVKDQNKWEKEEEDMKQIRKMIKKIAYKNERLMSSYKEKYPDYNDPESKNSDKYSKFVIEALGGDGDNNIEKENKIIKHIAKITTIKGK
jgi:hypothetical protein